MAINPSSAGTTDIQTHVFGYEGTRLTLDGQPFSFQGVSFFNALYNPAFNKSPEDRVAWLRAFKDNGVNSLRVWCQWDFKSPFDFVDIDPAHTMYNEAGEVQEASFHRLHELLLAMDSLGMVPELTLFSQEKKPNLSVEALERATREMTHRLRPYRHILLQIWNEDSTEVTRLFHAIKEIDSERVVTSSPGFGGDLGDDAQNEMLDVLTPHTSRGQGAFWDVATAELKSLLDKFQKPVIDDEPARSGIVLHGGIEGGTKPEQHIRHIQQVRAAGAYHVYHHDMFQLTYGHPTTPDNGIPGPDGTSFHRVVYDYLKTHTQWDVETSAAG